MLTHVTPVTHTFYYTLSTAYFLLYAFYSMLFTACFLLHTFYCTLSTAPLLHSQHRFQRYFNRGPYFSSIRIDTNKIYSGDRDVGFYNCKTEFMRQEKMDHLGTPDFGDLIGSDSDDDDNRWDIEENCEEEKPVLPSGMLLSYPHRGNHCSEIPHTAQTWQRRLFNCLDGP